MAASQQKVWRAGIATYRPSAAAQEDRDAEKCEKQRETRDFEVVAGPGVAEAIRAYAAARCRQSAEAYLLRHAGSVLTPWRLGVLYRV